MSKVAHGPANPHTPQEYNKNSTDKRGISSAVGVYVGVVKDNFDPLHFGRLEVWIPEFGGDPREKANWITVNYASPFAGSTSIFEQGNNVTKYKDTIKSYGFWGVPPDLDTRVLVAFASGRIELGYWFSCLYQRGTQISVPGIPAKRTYDGKPKPAAPKNKKDKNSDLELYVLHEPMYEALKTQGLDRDELRGLTSTSAERESPSKVIGFLTPEQQQFYIDDGDKKGNNRQIRLRTRNGVQLLLDDTSGHIYMISKEGNNWFEMNNDGQVMIYANNDISIRSEKNINLRADKDVNIEAGRAVNIKSENRSITMEAGRDIATYANRNTTITSRISSHIDSNVAHIENSATIHMNGLPALSTDQIYINQLVHNDGLTESICTVVPEHENWRGHSGKIPPKKDPKKMKEDPDPEQKPEEDEDEDYPPSCNSGRVVSAAKFAWYLQWRERMKENLRRYKRGEISYEEFLIEEARLTEEMIQVMYDNSDYQPVENEGAVGFGTETPAEGGTTTDGTGATGTGSGATGTGGTGGTGSGGTTGSSSAGSVGGTGSLILNRPIANSPPTSDVIGAFNVNEFERITREKESGNGQMMRTSLDGASTIGGLYGMSDASREAAWRSMTAERRAEIGYPDRPPTLNDLVSADGRSHTSDGARIADEALFRQGARNMVNGNQQAVADAWGNPNHRYTMADARGTWWHGPAGYPALVQAARNNPNMTVSDFYRSHPEWAYPDMRQFGGTREQTSRTVSQQLAYIQDNVRPRG